jgi:signal peptide peptidase SppA
MAAANAETWAIRPEWLQLAVEQAEHGAQLKRTPLPHVRGAVAVIPIHGVISQRESLFASIWGGTSTTSFEAAFYRAIQSPRISAVVLDVDSPGGTIHGVQMAAERVLAARGAKPVVAVANPNTHSAAYWIASAAGTLVAAPGADVGSIGVFRLHQDISGAMEREGVRATFIATPEFKTEGNPFEPLSEAGEAHHREQVEHTYRQFEGAVAKHRGVRREQVRRDFGRGRSYHAEQAAERGMVDGVKSMDRVIGEMGVGGAATLTKAESDLEQERLQTAWKLQEIDGPSGADDLRRKRLALEASYDRLD